MNLLADRTLYDEKAFKTLRIRGELEDLMRHGLDDLTRYDVRRLNRRLLEAAIDEVGEI